MERRHNNSSHRLACLRQQIAEEIAAGIGSAISNLDIADGAIGRGEAVQALLRRIKGELIATKNQAVILAANVAPEPKAIQRGEPTSVVPLRRAAE